MISNKNQYYGFYLCGLLSLITESVCAYPYSTNRAAVEPTTLKTILNQLAPYVVTLSAGPIWASGGKMQTFYVQPETERTYTANQQSEILADGELFLGLQREYLGRYQGQLGLAVATTSSLGISGDIWDDANPAFNNFSYHYQLRHTHIALKGKWLTEMRYAMMPYISASVGMGFNQSSNYSNTPTISIASPQPNFTNYTSTSFTYTVGAGIQRALTQHCVVGLGYDFGDWGASHLSTAPGQTVGGGLSLHHLYTNGLLFSISYLS